RLWGSRAFREVPKNLSRRAALCAVPTGMFDLDRYGVGTAVRQPLNDLAVPGPGSGRASHAQAQLPCSRCHVRIDGRRNVEFFSFLALVHRVFREARVLAPHERTLRSSTPTQAS